MNFQQQHRLLEMDTKWSKMAATPTERRNNDDQHQEYEDMIRENDYNSPEDIRVLIVCLDHLPYTLGDKQQAELTLMRNEAKVKFNNVKITITGSMFHTNSQNKNVRILCFTLFFYFLYIFFMLPKDD
jgi:hypothetical protein